MLQLGEGAMVWGKTKQRGGMGGRGRGKAGCLLSGLPFLTGTWSEDLAA